MKITEIEATDLERRNKQSNKDRKEAHIRVINNGFLVKTDKGWYCYKLETEVFLALSTYFKTLQP